MSREVAGALLSVLALILIQLAVSFLRERNKREQADWPKEEA